MIPDTDWFIAVIWVIFFIISLRARDMAIGVVGGFIGVFFGLVLITDVADWLGAMMIFFNLYLIYRALFPGEEKGGKKRGR